MSKLTHNHTAVVTVKLRPDGLSKLDAMAVRLHRSRADMVRQMIAHTELTGLPDIRVTGLEQHPTQGGRDAT
jgi:predicted transcriptional regulator